MLQFRCQHRILWSGSHSRCAAGAHQLGIPAEQEGDKPQRARRPKPSLARLQVMQDFAIFSEKLASALLV